MPDLPIRKQINWDNEKAYTTVNRYQITIIIEVNARTTKSRSIDFVTDCLLIGFFIILTRQLNIDNIHLYKQVKIC